MAFGLEFLSAAQSTGFARVNRIDFGAVNRALHQDRQRFGGRHDLRRLQHTVLRQERQDDRSPLLAHDLAVLLSARARCKPAVESLAREGPEKCEQFFAEAPGLFSGEGKRGSDIRPAT